MDYKKIILDNYNTYNNNIDNYYNYFKRYNIKMLALTTDKRSGILKHNNKKIYFYILNNKIDVEIY